MAPKRRGDAQKARGRRARGQAPKVGFGDVWRGMDMATVKQQKCGAKMCFTACAKGNFRQLTHTIRDPYDAKAFRRQSSRRSMASTELVPTSSLLLSSESGRRPSWQGSSRMMRQVPRRHEGVPTAVRARPRARRHDVLAHFGAVPDR